MYSIQCTLYSLPCILYTVLQSVCRYHPKISLQLRSVIDKTDKPAYNVTTGSFWSLIQTFVYTLRYTVQ